MTFTVLALFKDALSRQISEAIRIHYSVDNILNSKSEYMSNKISRLTIEEDAWERKERSRLEEEEEKVAKEEVEKFKKSKSHPPPGALLPKPKLTLHQAEQPANPQCRSKSKFLCRI